MLEAASRHTGLTPNKARALLGKFLFSGEEAEKPLAGLSGGERRRLSLAILVSSGANVLILDEPTNHLDLESREALEDALLAFEGAVILVSHDRALLDAVGTRTVAIEAGAAALVRGRLGRVPAGARGAPRARRGRRRGPPPTSRRRKRRRASPRRHRSRGNGRGSRKPAGPSKNALRREEELQKAVEEAEAALKQVEDELADPAAWATKYEAAKSEARHTAAKRAVEAALAAWEAHAAKVEEAAATAKPPAGT